MPSNKAIPPAKVVRNKQNASAINFDIGNNFNLPKMAFQNKIKIMVKEPLVKSAMRGFYHFYSCYFWPINLITKSLNHPKQQIQCSKENTMKPKKSPR